MGNLRHTWQPAFLAALEQTGIISDACKLASIDRTTVYRARQSDESFAKAFDDAMEAAIDTLEREARRRAVEGTEEPVYQGGQLIGTKTVYSDSLMALLLKGRRKGVFADRTELTGANGGPVQASVVIATGVPNDVPDADIA